MVLASIVRQAWSLPLPGLTNWQAPATQAAPCGQAKPQLPQLLGSAGAAGSPPLAAVLLPSPKPRLHWSAHAPALHAATALAPPTHAVHELPAQPCAGSAGTHMLLHIFWLAPQPESGLPLPARSTPPPPERSAPGIIARSPPP